jgi:2-(1,2-epoxy-1,2-dihydrophenyl)acetyl-CoA isomerase
MATSPALVLLDKNERIATVTLNRPQKLNALTADMVIQLKEALDEVRADNGIRSVVLRGAGRAFCAGDDLGHEDRFKFGNPDLQTRLKVAYPAALLDLLQLRKPLVAMIRGYAVGAGMDVALGCDFRIAETTARMAAIFVKRGMGGGCSYLLPRFVGLGKATELLLLGDYVDMEEAMHLGLVNRVVPEAELETATYALAGRLANGPTGSYGSIKNARNQGLGCDPVKGLEYQIMANVELMFYKDAREGPLSFAEKRDPEFTGEWVDLQYH